LATAHAAGILHRDVKPENILVFKTGYAKLADFGLAKLEQPSTGIATTTATVSHTKPRAMIGTIAYMSPEQASGRPLDARSDTFFVRRGAVRDADGEANVHGCIEP
jgi:serine/threonine protein kinase